MIQVDELLHCYLESLNCSFFRNVSNDAPLPNTPAPLYVGVHGNNNTVTRLTGLTLAYLTGTETPANYTECLNRTLPVSEQHLQVDFYNMLYNI